MCPVYFSRPENQGGQSQNNHTGVVDFQGGRGKGAFASSSSSSWPPINKIYCGSLCSLLRCFSITKSTTESVRLSGNAGEMLKGHGVYFPFKLALFLVTISCTLSVTDCIKFLFSLRICCSGKRRTFLQVSPRFSVVKIHAILRGNFNSLFVVILALLLDKNLGQKS